MDAIDFQVSYDRYTDEMICVNVIYLATVARDAPIIPISAQLKYNIDAVNEYICTKIPVPKHDFNADARLIVIRSFDVNKPGSTVDELKGGVAGGSILSGVFKVSTASKHDGDYGLVD